MTGGGATGTPAAAAHWPPAAPMLVALLRQALPDATMLDFGAASGRMFPWWPGALYGVADAAALPLAERELLRRFRQGGRGDPWPILGLDPAGDAALLSNGGRVGADRLVCEAAGRSNQHDRLAGPDGLLLRPAPPGSEPGFPPGVARILLLIGSAARVEPWELLFPVDRTATLFTGLRAAADALAANDTGWQAGGRLVSPRLATVALLRHHDAPAPLLRIRPETLPHDLQGAVPDPHSPGGLTTGPVLRVRLLLGHLPPMPMRLRLRFRGGTPRALFLDGRREAAEQGAGPDGVAEWEVPMHPAAEHPTVLGLALPEGGLTLDALDLLA